MRAGLKGVFEYLVTIIVITIIIFILLILLLLLFFNNTNKINQFWLLLYSLDLFVKVALF